MEKKQKYMLYLHKIDTKEIKLDSEPCFFDALQLLKPYQPNCYGQTPLEQSISGHSCRTSDILLPLHNSDKLTDQPALIYEGSRSSSLSFCMPNRTMRTKVAFAIQMPDSRVKKKEKSPLPSLAEYKRQKRTL